MKIIIAGAGNVGTHLAKLLSREKQDIILMDDDEEKLSALSANFVLEPKRQWRVSTTMNIFYPKIKSFSKSWE